MSVRRELRQPTSIGFSRLDAALLAVGLMALTHNHVLASLSRPLRIWIFVLAVVALAAAGGLSEWDGHLAGRLGAALIAVAAIVGALSYFRFQPEIIPPLLFVAAPAGVGVVVAWRRWPDIPPWVLALSVAGLVAGVSLLISVTTKPPIDVLEFHEESARLLRAGSNPYSDAAVLSTNPFDRGAPLQRYPYPPLVLMMVTLSQILLGDTRWVILVATLAAVAVWWSSRRPFAHVAALFTATSIIGAICVYVGWTEPLALPFIASSFLLWSTPLLSGVLLGLAAATKQYFLLLVPLLIFARDEGKWRRLGAMALVNLVIALPFLLWDAGALWAAIGTGLLDLDPRPDSINLVGLGWLIPSWIGFVAATLCAVYLGWLSRGPGDLALGAAVVLGVSFLFGSQAFTNYLLMPVALTLASITLVERNAVAQSG